MLSRMITISIYIPEELKQRIDKLADDQQRSVSNMISILLKNSIDELKNVNKLVEQRNEKERT